MTHRLDYVEEARELGRDVWVYGAATEVQIANLEEALGYSLPESYRQFLASAGALSIGDVSVSGIIDGDPLSLDGGSAFGETHRARRDQGIPTSFLVIQPDADAPHCLDLSFSSDAEQPVVCFQACTRSAKRIAPSFEQWYFTFILGRV
jgi:hypothetical protein